MGTFRLQHEGNLTFNKTEGSIQPQLRFNIEYRNAKILKKVSHKRVRRSFASAKTKPNFKFFCLNSKHPVFATLVQTFCTLKAT